jgi:hypothetical protein
MSDDALSLEKMMEVMQTNILRLTDGLQGQTRLITSLTDRLADGDLSAKQVVSCTDSTDPSDRSDSSSFVTGKKATTIQMMQGRNAVDAVNSFSLSVSLFLAHCLSVSLSHRLPHVCLWIYLMYCVGESDVGPGH